MSHAEFFDSEQSGPRIRPGRPRKGASQRRIALSVTVSQRTWTHAHLLAEHFGKSVSEVIDELITIACKTPPHSHYLTECFRTSSLEEAFMRLTAARGRPNEDNKRVNGS